MREVRALLFLLLYEYRVDSVYNTVTPSDEEDDQVRLAIASGVCSATIMCNDDENI